MSDNCDICCIQIRDDEEALYCEECEKWSHKACLNMSRTTFKRLEKSPLPWICDPCKKKMDSRNRKTDKNNKVAAQKENYTLEDVMKKLNEMDDKYNRVLKQYDEQMRVNEELRKELQTVKRDLNNRDQKELNNNVIIQGVPSVVNEKVETVVEKLANKLKVTRNIEKAYRLGNPNQERASSAIKIIFKSYDDKKQWMQAKKSYKLSTGDLGYNDINEAIYINHDLTKRNIELFKMAKQFKKDHDYKYLWVSNGKIMIRKNDTSKSFLIEDASDLKN